MPKTDLTFLEVSSHQHYCHLADTLDERARHQRRIESGLLPLTPQDFKLPGYCYPCGRQVEFSVDYLYADPTAQPHRPNWRERMICPLCGLNNRMRAVIHGFSLYSRTGRHAALYLTEQVTPLYRWFKKQYPKTFGSEFIAPGEPPGSLHQRGFLKYIRHEDFTQLSFADASLDSILTFDVLEHIPHEEQALHEAWRCLKPGGLLLLTAPFNPTSLENVRRATIDEHGKIHHLLPPEYHGNPINPEGGCLCYHCFGWALLDDLRALGFQDVKCLFYWSDTFGYLGGEQIIITARKPQ